MNYHSLFEKYLITKDENKQIQTPASSSIETLEEKKMLGKSNISEEEFDKIFEEILKRKI
jgi:hypothetical protein